MLCLECLKHPSILRFARTIAVSSRDDCAVCGARAAPKVPTGDPEFKARFRALVRYYFSETAYNTHLGGDHPTTLFFRENPLTRFRSTWNAAAYESELLEVLEEGYENGDTRVSLFAGYSDGQQNMLLRSLKLDIDDRLHEVKRRARVENHFIVEGNARALLEPLVERLDATLPGDAALWRARVGFVDRGFPLTGWFEERDYMPLTSAELGAPPPPLASPGRMNRGGVSYLYLSTTADTAVAEIRPHPGHYCSVGSFVAKRDVRVCDLSKLDVCDFASDALLNDFLLLKSVDDAFSIPVVPEDRAEYHFPQLLADVFRHFGYDGIGYRSSVGAGRNYVFFNPALFGYVADSARVVRIEALNYSTVEQRVMRRDQQYLTRGDGSLV
jgi:hypothetical protein